MSVRQESLIEWSRYPACKELFDVLPVPLLLLDDQGRIFWNNQSWGQFAAQGSGTRSKDSGTDGQGKSWTQSLPIGPSLDKAFREFLLSGSSWTSAQIAFDPRFPGLAIDVRFYRTTEPAGVLCAFDHHPRPALREASHSVESTLPWFTVDPTGKITHCSQSLRQILRSGSAGIEGLHAWDLLHADDRDAYRQTLLEHCAAARPHPACQIRVTTLEGGQMVSVAHAASIIGTAGQFRGLRIALFDVTEREQAQEALTKSRDLYRTLAECCGVGVWHVSDLGHTLYVNPTMCELLEIDSADELIDATVNDFFPPESRERIAAEEAQRRPGQISCYEVELIGKRGTRRQTQVTGATLRDSEQQVSGFLATFTDITARHQRELELRQTQKLEAVGRLAAGIAHEINTPVQFVSDSIHFLQEAIQDVQSLLIRYRAVVADPSNLAEEREQLLQLERDIDLEDLQQQMPRAAERAIEGLNRVATIVRAMKDFAHPDDGRKGPVNLNQALINTLTIARNEYKYVADVVTDFSDLPPVLCNLSELNQVFLNVLVNAAQAIAEKARQHPGFHGVISVMTRLEDDHVAITIRDTGTGIPATVCHKIFDPFFTTKPVGSGTGQGLAIAHAVIERHGGTITFTTETGQGTSFLIRLPLQGASQAQPGADPE